MRVIWVSSQLPSLQAGAGEVLEYELLRQACLAHEVHVITSAIAPGDEAPHLEAIGATYEAVTWQRSPFPRTKAGLLWELAAKDSGVILWRHGDRAKALAAALERMQSETKVDFVQVVMSETAPVLASAIRPRALLLFDAHVRQLQRELGEAENMRRRLAWRAQLRKAQQWERMWYKLADGIACNSSLDAAALAALLEQDVAVVPNPVPREFFEAPSVLRSGDVVTFVAHLGYRPNVDAAFWFMKEIWPIVIEHLPDAKLRLVGRRPISDIVSAAAEVNATVEGDVPDVRPAYWTAAVAVAPIRLGSGLRNKVLHAMACGVPLVATSVAIEGLDLAHGRELLVADDAPSFAKAILETMTDRSGALERAARGRVFAQGLHGDAVGDGFVEWWERTARTVR